MEKKEKSKIGKKSRAAGKRFELKVRSKLEAQGFIVVKWANQVDLINNKLIPAKSKYNPFLKRVMSEGSGFPDFLCYKSGVETEVIGVESKLGKYLDADEKKKVQWLLKNKIFSRIFSAYPGKKRGEIELEELNEEEQLD